MRKNIIKISLLAVTITVTALALGSWRSDSTTPPCEESMDQCCKKRDRNADGTIWETGSGQFFTSFELN